MTENSEEAAVSSVLGVVGQHSSDPHPDFSLFSNKYQSPSAISGASSNLLNPEEDQQKIISDLGLDFLDDDLILPDC